MGNGHTWHPSGFYICGVTINQELPALPLLHDQVASYQVLSEVSRPGHRGQEMQQFYTIPSGSIQPGATCDPAKSLGTEWLDTIVLRAYRMEEGERPNGL